MFLVPFTDICPDTATSPILKQVIYITVNIATNNFFSYEQEMITLNALFNLNIMGIFIGSNLATYITKLFTPCINVFDQKGCTNV